MGGPPISTAPRERRGTSGHGSGGSPTPGRGATHSPRTPRRRSTSPRCGCREASRSRSSPSARVARCTVSRTRPGSSSRGRAPRRRAGTSRRRTRGWRSTASCADARPPACSSPTRTRAARSTAAATPSWRRWSCASGCARSPARGGGRTRPSPRPPPASSSAAKASSRTSPTAWSPNPWGRRGRARGRPEPEVQRAARRESRPGPRFRPVAILQALISLIARSAGKILNAIFGWAVVALFGQTSPKEQTKLSAVVAAAAAWPLLVLGIAVPRVTLFVVSFVPLSKSVPSLWLRIVWIALALLVPVVVGAVIAARSPPSVLPEPGWKKFLRGFQVTLALAIAFLLMLVVAPGLKIANALTGRIDVRLPVLLMKGAGPELVDALVAALLAYGIEVHPAEPPWTMTAPAGVLRRLGGRAFSSFVGEETLYRVGEGLQLNLNPNELLLRGKPDRVLRALVARVHEIAREMSRSDVPFDEWQIVYRELLQLDRALRGEPPLLAQEEEMADRKRVEGTPERIALPPAASVPVRLESMSNKELLQHITQNAVLLAKKEVELAKAELKADLKKEVAMAKGLGVAGLCAIWTVSMMLVAVAMALGTALPEWAAALIVAAAVLLVGTAAGLVGWGKRVTEPLEMTRRTLKEDVQWAKERIA